MNPSPFARYLVLGCLLPAHAALAAVCEGESGRTRVPLVELYTSEGCSSCPPADLRLQALGRQPDTALAPLAMHVNYWDHLGWRDPYALPGMADRQRWLARANGSTLVYTPEFFVNGREVRDPRAVAAEAQRVAAMPSAATLRATAAPQPDGSWRLDLAARWDTRHAMQLVVALTESGLASKVRAGENAGETLRHGHVARAFWTSEFTAGPTIAWSERFRPSAEQLAKGMELVAYLQDPRNGEILQALRLPSCVRN